MKRGWCGGVAFSGVACVGALLAGTAMGDQFHYNNVIVGDRAMGLGGAYAGISDDASGMVYNPGGLGFALSNDISGSANAFYSKTVTYKEAVYGEDYSERSSGTIAPFFGGLQKLDKISDGLVMAFGMYSRDSNLMEQNDEIPKYGFHRAINHKASTVYVGAALAKRLSATLSVGFGLNYLMIDELTQDFQYSGTTTRLLAQNSRELLMARGVEPTFGIQAALGSKLSVGAMVRMPYATTQKVDYYLDKIQFAPQASARAVVWDGTNPTIISNPYESEEPLGTLPWEARVGLAWFASPRFMWSFDVNYVTEVTDAEVIATDYNKDAVFNIATGVEYYVTPSLPARLGFFTNRDSRPALDESLKGQRDSVNYYGFPVFLGWVQSNSQISAGVVYQKGTGQAQKIYNSATVQDIEASMTTLAFSASHSF